MFSIRWTLHVKMLCIMLIMYLHVKHYLLKSSSFSEGQTIGHIITFLLVTQIWAYLVMTSCDWSRAAAQGG